MDSYNPKIINKGSVDDIRNSLHFARSRLSIEDLEREIEAEKETLNRQTVIRMLQAEVRKKRRHIAKGGLV